MWLYNIVVNLYGIIIRLAALNNLKAGQWISGRNNWREVLALKVSELNSKKIIWFHCASYGEFEQGRPLMETIKKKHSSYKIVLSFFSPSGYEVFKNWSGADIICYLPLDTKKNAKDFINIIKPEISIFIKYEFWLNFLFELKKQTVPTYLVSAVFKPHHPFFKWYGKLFKKSLNTFNVLFIQDEDSGILLNNIGVRNYEVCGDTRFDRVLEIKENFSELPFVKEFCSDKKIIVAGSTWQGDEELLVEAYKNFDVNELKLIIAPHNVDEKSVSKLTALLQKNNLEFVLYSNQSQNSNAPILVVNTIGILSKIYNYATLAYIGGGLNDGIHNCLEPAVYYKPVLFYGNDYHKFNEAVDLIKLNAAKNILSAKSLEFEISQFIDNKSRLAEIESVLRVYFQKKSGTTKQILSKLNLN